MKVKIVATGEVYNVPNQYDPLVQLMIKTGQIEPVMSAPPAAKQNPAEWVPPKTPAVWSVQEEDSTGAKIICWACPTCKQGGRFVGTKPDKVHLLRAWHCGHEGGEPVSAPVAARYIASNRRAAPVFVEPLQPAPDRPLDANLQPIDVFRIQPVGADYTGVTAQALADAEAAYLADLKAAQGEKQ